MTDLDHHWQPPSPDLALLNNDVHVWRASLEHTGECVHQLAQTLSRDEISRAERFRFERDRRRFIVGRGVLRTILGHYLGVEPDKVQFRYSPRGKPYLMERFDSRGLRFNLAHSHELALYAFTRDREIGVDLEYVRPLPDAMEIATRFFSTRENAVLRLLPKSQKLEAFYNCWTRQEAYLKAIGDGLVRPLDQFAVSLAPGEPARLLQVEESLQSARWSLRALRPAFSYVAAVAVEGHDWQLKCWRWTWTQG